MEKVDGETEVAPMWEGLASVGTFDKVPDLVSLAGTARTFPPLHSLRDLPAHCWHRIEKPASGYNYRIHVMVGTVSLLALLDTGASTNAVSEEVILRLWEAASGMGISLEDERWPVARLEHWSSSEKVLGVAKGTTLEVIGRALLRVSFTGMDGRSAVRTIAFKILKKGCCGFMGLIIGGPSLEQQCGLGLTTTPTGHFLKALGLFLERDERADVMARMDSFLLAQVRLCEWEGNGCPVQGRSRVASRRFGVRVRLGSLPEWLCRKHTVGSAN